MSVRNRYDGLFQHFTADRGIGWTALKAQAIAESDLDPLAVSPAGACGLMQFMPRTWEEWAPGRDPFDAADSIRAGAAYMAWLLKQLDRDYERAWAAYNWGIGNVLRAGSSWRSHLPAETRDYIARIQRLAGVLSSGR